jgi:hypothetical protein
MYVKASHAKIGMSDRITLNIMVPGRGRKQVSVSRAAPISTLSTFIPMLEVEFVCNGELLSPERPVGFYNLLERDTIVGVLKNPGSYSANHWMAITRDSDTFTESIRAHSELDLKPEFRRLSDLRNTRIEANPRKFLRKCRRFVPLAVSARASTTLVIPERPDIASTEPLPICW